MKLSNINQPTPAKWVKIGSALIAISTFIGGYSLTAQNTIVGYIGLSLGTIGTALIAFKS